MIVDGPTPPSDRIVIGNAHADGASRGGWFVAGFVEPEHGLRRRFGHLDALTDAQGDFELKLFAHKTGDAEVRHFPFNRTATTVSMLISPGRLALEFLDRGRSWRVVLEAEGDYAIWAPGVAHRWRALEDSTIFTLRCPGVDATDQAETPTNMAPSPGD